MATRQRNGEAAGRPVGRMLGVIVLALGAESTIRVLTDWVAGGDLTLATGLLMVAGGTGLLLGSRSTLGIAAWALRAQLVVTVLATVLTVWAQVAAGVPAGRVPAVPLVLVIATGVAYAAVCLVALRWIRRRLSEP